MSEDRFYTVEGVEDFASELGVNARDAFKYLVSAVVSGVDTEAEKLTPDLLKAFEGLKENCEEFINTFNYYSIELELFQKAEAEGRAEEVRENLGEFIAEVIKELKARNS